MARDRWQIWRFCIACNAKFQGSSDNLKFGHRDQTSDNPREMSFYLECDACGTVNPLEESLIPSFIQELVKKEFYRQRTKPPQKKRNL